MTVQFARPDISELMFSVFERSVHPELFQNFVGQKLAGNHYQATIQICDAGHWLTFHHADQTVTEVLSTRTQPLPQQKHLLTKQLRGHREQSLQLSCGLSYHLGFHLEQLDPEQFVNLHEELLQDYSDVSLAYRFPSQSRFIWDSLSLIRIDAQASSLLVHAIHTFPESDAVVRCQSLFEV